MSLWTLWIMYGSWSDPWTSTRGLPTLLMDFNVISGIGLQAEKSCRAEAAPAAKPQRQQEDGEDGSDWETASEEEVDGLGPLPEGQQQQSGSEDGEGEQWEEWDVRRSLFDNHLSKWVCAVLW